MFKGTIHRLGMLVRNPNIMKEIFAALGLCTNLRSLTWIDDSYNTDSSLLRLLGAVRTLPLRELTIRTHGDPSKEVWSRLISIVGLEKVSLSCIQVPSVALQDWSKLLRSTLTHLELSVCVLFCFGELVYHAVFLLSERDVTMIRWPLLRFFNGYRFFGTFAWEVLLRMQFCPYLATFQGYYHSTPSTMSQTRLHSFLGRQLISCILSAVQQVFGCRHCGTSLFAQASSPLTDPKCSGNGYAISYHSLAWKLSISMGFLGILTRRFHGHS